MPHMMVDLETMGTRPGSAIVSIGACVFDPNAGTSRPPAKTYYQNVDLQSCVDAGLRCDAGTIGWWMKQSEEARQALTGQGEPIHVALKGLFAFAAGCKHVWGHGAGFDPVLLDSAAYACRLPVPWKFWDVRDTRTLFHLAQFKKADWQPKRTGTHHNALDDAVWQAACVQEALALLGCGV